MLPVHRPRWSLVQNSQKTLKVRGLTNLDTEPAKESLTPGAKNITMNEKLDNFHLFKCCHMKELPLSKWKT